MPEEIERRFLPRSPEWRPEGKGVHLVQGYFKLGETATGQPALWPWPHFRVNGLRLVWLSWKDWASLRPHCTAEGGLPKGWKARIRSYDNRRFVLDIKGPRNGTTRFELDEQPLSPKAGHALLEQCRETVLSKTRYTLSHAGQDWHVDVFDAPHSGLITCEAELTSADAPLELPPWVGEEITGRKLFTA